MKKFSVAVCLLFVALVLPDPAHAQSKWITVYTDDFSGNSYQFGPGRYDNVYLLESGISQIYSLKVPAGMRATLYSNDNFNGNSLVLTQDAPTSYLKSRGFAQIGLWVSLVVDIAPDDPVTTGPAITIYKDDFSGASKILAPGRYEFQDFGAVENDQLSSLKIPKGLKVTLYEHSGFSGRSLVLTGDTRATELVNNKFNDVASSMVVEEQPHAHGVAAATPVVVQNVIVVHDTIKVAETKPVETAAPLPVITVYEGNFTGLRNTFAPGRYADIYQQGVHEGELSSVKVPRDLKVTLFEGVNFQGRSLVLTKDTPASFLHDNHFITSSLVVDLLPAVTVYQGDYAGASQRLVPGRYVLNDMGMGDNQISSVRVPSGLKVTLFEGDAFQGKSLTLTQDTGTDLMTRYMFNDITSSVIVETVGNEVPVVTLYQENFSGLSKSLAPGKYESENMGIENNTLSSIKVPWGLRVRLFEYGGYEGRSMELRSDADAAFFTSNSFNDITSSVIVEQVPASENTVTLYRDSYAGPFQILAPGRYTGSTLTIGSRQMTSAKVPKGMRVTMFSEDNFGGSNVTLEHDVDFSNTELNDWASSLIVEDLFVPVVTPLANQPTVTQVVVPVVVAADPAPVTQTETVPCAMTSQQYDNAVKAVQSKAFKDEKMDMALLATRDKCMNNQQIRGIARLFNFEDQTLEFVKYAYDLSSEKSEYYTLDDLFKFYSDKEAFTEFLKSKN